MNTKILEYIIAIAETKSISQAAEQFYLSRPALTKHIKNIEARIGTPLFYQNNKQLELTPAGVIYVNNANAILQLEKKLYKDLEKLKGEKRSTLKIALEFSYKNFFLRKILPAFREHYPDITLQMLDANSSKAMSLLHNHEVQFAIINSRASEFPDIETIPLVSDELCFVAPKGSPQAICCRNKDFSNPVLQDSLFLLHTHEQTLRQFEAEALSDFGIIPKNIMEVSLLYQIIDHVREGNCCGLVPQIRLNRISQDQSIEAFHFDKPFIYNTLLTFPGNTMLSKPESVMMNIIIDEFQKFEDYILNDQGVK